MLAALLLALVAQPAAKSPAAGASDSTVAVTPGKKYGGGWLHRFFLGEAWRELWLDPIRVPVANLDTMAGGLTATDKGGHAQTLSLRFCSADGRTFTFRSIDKRPTQAFSGLMNTPIPRWIANEQISAMFPAAAVAAEQFERAAGLPVFERQMVVLPDSPRLGKWRDEFKGMLGVFEPRHPEDKGGPAGFPGAKELISSDSLLPRLRAGAVNRLDQTTFLTARLLDFFLGDWDRHAGQWSWARFDRDGVRWWVPVPRDRDWAFSRFDGIGYDLIRYVKPNWTEFGPRFGKVRGLTISAEPLDRRLLSGLDQAEWEATTAALQQRLSDAVIADALAALPREFDQHVLADVGASLRRRRDALKDFALSYYRSLAHDVDIRASDDAEVARIDREPNGAVTIELSARGTPVYHRRFLPGETSEVRLYLLGGADTVRATGNSAGVPVRVIPGGGQNLITDSGTGLRVYDDSATTRVSGPGVRRFERPFTSPVRDDRPGELYRDWGHRFGIAPWFSLRPELGVVMGGGPVLTTYGFRRVPYQSRLALRVATTTKRGEVNADLAGDFHFERPDRRLLLRAVLLNADVIRYFGLGNETTRSDVDGFNNITQQRYAFEPVLLLGLGGAASFAVGGMIQWSEPDSRVTKLSVDSTYGGGSFTELGLRGGLVYDSRDDEKIPTRGIRIELTGRAYPKVLDVTSTFESLELVGSTYLTAASLPASPTLALRAGTKRMFGKYPYFEAADIGGKLSFRGATTRRFTGDASAYANLDLRLNLGDLGLGPDHWGILGLADAGRVYLDGESSRHWHTGFGGGFWTKLSGHLVTATLAGGGERLRFYLNSGFHF